MYNYTFYYPNYEKKLFDNESLLQFPSEGFEEKEIK